MDAAAIALVLVSAGLHAAWNLLHHRSEDRLATIAFAYFIGGFVLLPVAVVNPPSEVVRWLTASIIFHAGYQYLLSSAFARGGLSITYPIARGVSPFLVALGGWLWLDQSPSLSTIIGIGFVTAGLLALVRLGRELTQLDAVGFAALTGIAIAGYSLIDARAVESAHPIGYFSVTACSAGLVLMITARITPARVVRIWKVGATIGAAQTGGYIMILYAFQRAQAAQVASLRQLSVVVGVLIAGEMARRQATVSAALIALGAILLAS